MLGQGGELLGVVADGLEAGRDCGRVAGCLDDPLALGDGSGVAAGRLLRHPGLLPGLDPAAPHFAGDT
jgi:hypothetical protein